MTVV
jgi:hypothetical protein